jgi:hypothetical protein
VIKKNAICQYTLQLGRDKQHILACLRFFLRVSVLATIVPSTSFLCPSSCWLEHEPLVCKSMDPKDLDNAWGSENAKEECWVYQRRGHHTLQQSNLIFFLCVHERNKSPSCYSYSILIFLKHPNLIMFIDIEFMRINKK